MIFTEFFLVLIYFKRITILINLPISYSTVTDLAKLRGLSTSHSR